MGWPVGEGVRNWGSSPASNNVNVDLARNNGLMTRAANPAFTMQKVVVLEKLRPISGLSPLLSMTSRAAPLGRPWGAPLLAWLIMD